MIYMRSSHWRLWWRLCWRLRRRGARLLPAVRGSPPRGAVRQRGSPRSFSPRVPLGVPSDRGVLPWTFSPREGTLPRDLEQKHGREGREGEKTMEGRRSGRLTPQSSPPATRTAGGPRTPAWRRNGTSGAAEKARVAGTTTPPASSPESTGGSSWRSTSGSGST